MTSDDLSEDNGPVSELPGDRLDGFDAEQMGAGVLALLDGFRAVMISLARALEETLRRPELQAKLRRAERMMMECHKRIVAVEAPGYLPYFERLGHDGITARLQVMMLRSLAERSCRESRDRRVALSALHDLARRPRWHPALSQQVHRLYENCWDAECIDEACRLAGCPELGDEFLRLLRSTAWGDTSGGPRLIEIARWIGPLAPSPRGRYLAYDTALHRTFLRWSAEFGGRQAYTYGPVPTSIDAADDFIDEATAATRIELNRPSFNPVPARRAERRRLAREREDELETEHTELRRTAVQTPRN